MRKVAATTLGATIPLLVVGGALAHVSNHTVEITSGPSGTVTSTTAAFAFTSSATASFTCSIDNGALKTCGRPGTGGAITYPDLAVGTHQFIVVATVTRAAVHQARASRSWTIAVDPAPSPPPRGLRRVPAKVVKSRLNGPFVMTPKALRGIATKRRPPGQPFLPTASELDASPDVIGTCPQPVCADDDHKIETRFLPSILSPPLQTTFVCCSGEIDPQLAAGSGSHLVVGLRDFVRFYDKSGQPLAIKSPVRVGSGQPKTQFMYGKIPLCDLFAPLIPNVNAQLTLPTQQKDADGNAITWQNGYGINCDKTTGGKMPKSWSFDRNGDGKIVAEDDFYWPDTEFSDARVLWDEYRKRFVIVSLMKNHNSTWADPKTYPPAKWVNRPANRSDKVADAIRSMLAIAVSKTPDPRDGWNLYWTYAIPGQESCPNNVCKVGLHKVGAESDYLSMGITSKYLVLEYRAGWLDVAHYDPKTDKEPFSTFTRTITAIQIDPLPTDKQKLAAVYQTDSVKKLTTPDGKEVDTWAVIQPAVQHAPDVTAQPVLLASKWVDGARKESDPLKYNVLLWALDFEAGDHYQLAVPVRKFLNVDSALSQRAHPDFGASATPTLGGDTQRFVNKLVYRKGNLYLTFDECGVWKKAAEPHCQLSALRFLRLQLKGIVKKQGKIDELFVEVAVDRKFGGRNVLDPPGKLAWYSFPSVEANKNGDAALVYHRSADWLYTQARYSVHYLKQKDIRPSRPLALGTYTLGTGTTASWHHYVGMSVDGFDDTGIWMITGYAAKAGTKWGIWAYAIGKVLGKPYVDLSLAPFALVRARADGSAARYSLSVRLENTGDRRAAPTRARLALSRDTKAGDDLPLKNVQIPALAAGRKQTIDLKVAIPTNAHRRGYRYLVITLDATRKLKEYSESNNTSYVRLP